VLILAGMEATKVLSEPRLKTEAGEGHFYKNTLPKDPDAWVLQACGTELSEDDWSWPDLIARVGQCNLGRHKASIDIQVHAGDDVTGKLITEVRNISEQLLTEVQTEAEEQEGNKFE